MGKTWRAWPKYWWLRMGRKKEKSLKNASNFIYIQDFASQVKAINSQKGPIPPKPMGKRD